LPSDLSKGQYFGQLNSPLEYLLTSERFTHSKTSPEKMLMPSEMLVFVKFQNYARYHDLNKELDPLNLDASLDFLRFR
jgi:hypothetical protein